MGNSVATTTEQCFPDRRGGAFVDDHGFDCASIAVDEPIVLGCHSSGLPSPGTGGKSYWNALLVQAARDGNVKLLTRAVHEGARVNTRCRGARLMVQQQETCSEHQHEPRHSKGLKLTPLMYAAVGGHLECVRVLLDRRADVTKQDDDGMTALHFAASAGCLEVADAIVCGGGRPSSVDDYGCGLLEHLAADAKENPRELARWLALMDRDEESIHAA
eukprot:TRINITY_DN36407_c0_g1_i1.p1 TRINITY_DN36407_c0_g1~~TRINITY_DN36407_c0_g1_i1.p1  ORF type:complete len:217 (+),score=25.25 TRINITY_DN36407_c0_g1_i1:306-956(+)